MNFLFPYRMRHVALALSSLVTLALPAAAQHDMSVGGSQTTIHGFTDISWLSGGRETGRNAAFGVGQFDLFISSRLNDRFSFQGETVFEFDKVSNGFVVDVERVIVTYALNEHLRLSGGKMHTPLGYWNNAYHHGLALQPTISRPMVVNFEDGGGPLPIHTAGVQLSGRDMTQAHLGFDVLVGNGLGNRPVADTSPSPSVTLAVHSQLTPSLRVGVSGYRAESAAGADTRRGDLLAAPLTQNIAGAFATYFGERAEAIVEAQRVIDRSAGRTTTSPGWLAYVGARVAPQLVPYLMHDELHLALNDPYFVATDIRRETIGLRLEQSSAVVLKLELRSIDKRGASRATELGAQVAVAF